MKMLLRVMTFLVLLAIAARLFFPDGFPFEELERHARTIAPAATDRIAGPEEERDDVMAPLLTEEVVLKRAMDGHFYANAEVGFRTVRFLVDTGATVVALTAADARDLNFFWDKSEMTLIGHGANGPIYGKRVSIDEMAVGGVRAQNVPAVIIPEGLAISLLGQSFLSRVGRISIEGNEMVLNTEGASGT